MTDTELLDWIELNSARYLILPPTSEKGDDYWAVYDGGHRYVAGGMSLRECLIRTISCLREEENAQSGTI